MKERKEKKNRRSLKASMISLLLLVGMLSVLATAPLMAYQISKGDTLWDISGKFLQNPFLWPKVWALNPYIFNPNWIYPGNKLRLKAPKPPVLLEKPAPQTVQPQAQPSHAVQKPAPAPKPNLFTYEDVHAAGFVAESRLDEVGRVLTNENGTPLNVAPNTLCFYAKRGATIHPGDRYTAFTYVKTVHDPHAKCKIIGYLVQLGGDLEVTRVKGRFCFAKVIHSYQEIENGDSIGRFEQWPNKFPIIPFKKPLNASIIIMKDGLMLATQNKVVYIDKGSADGLRQGDELSIYKSCPAGHDPYQACCKARQKITPPDRKVGSLIVLATRPHTATAVIYTNEREIEVGDSVRP